MKSVEFYRHTLGDREHESIGETLAGLFLTLGPRVKRFEGRFAEYLGVQHGVGVSSCTMGLLLTLRAMDIGAGDEVITTPMTFVATSNAVIHAGATPVFADIDPSTGLLDPDAVEAAITDRTKAIVVVHLYGQLVDMKRFRAIADKHDLRLVEDCAHSVEAERDGYRSGHLGDAGVFSFYATKAMTSGDGGMVVTNSALLAERLRRLRNHGVSKDAVDRHGGSYQHWRMLELGYKAALTDIEAALLEPQLDRLDAQRAMRQALVERYEALLRGVDGVALLETAGRSAHHLFTVRVAQELRNDVLKGLGKFNIGCAVNYTAVHGHPYYRETFGFEPQDFPAAYAFGEQTISLPLWPRLPEDSVDYVVESLKTILETSAFEV